MKTKSTGLDLKEKRKIYDWQQEEGTRYEKPYDPCYTQSDLTKGNGKEAKIFKQQIKMIGFLDRVEETRHSFKMFKKLYLIIQERDNDNLG